MSSVASKICSFCGFGMPISADRCPHCARPSLFPNVEMASDQAEVAALDVRYDRAVANALAHGTATIAAELEREAATKSRVVISRDSSEVYRLACGDNQLYTTYYKLVEAGFRLPTESKWDAIRIKVDTMMFPYYQKEVRFGALTLNGSGLNHYGDCHMILKTSLIDFRTSTFTENTATFAVRERFQIPLGHRASWARRGRLAVAKLSAKLTPSSTLTELPALLKGDGATSDDDSFLEAQVYGSISVNTIEQVSIARKARLAVRFGALKEKLKKLGVPVEMM